MNPLKIGIFLKLWDLGVFRFSFHKHVVLGMVYGLAWYQLQKPLEQLYLKIPLK